MNGGDLKNEKDCLKIWNEDLNLAFGKIGIK